MPISPSEFEAYAVEVGRIYAETEAALLSKIARQMARGADAPDWLQRKLAESRQLRRFIEQTIRELQRTDAAVADKLADNYAEGARLADADLLRLAGVEPTFFATNQRAVSALVQTYMRKATQTHFMVLRQAEDRYRRVIYDTSSLVTTGAYTVREALQTSLNQWADDGVTAFVDKRGRKWSLDGYGEMAVRTSTGQAAMEGHFDRLTSRGYELVIVSDSPEECEICRPWEGRILAVTKEGATVHGVPSVADATDAGLWHPNCTHAAGAYIHGVTEPIHADANPQGYNERQQQRHNERQIRHWKRREAVAITEQAKAQARGKVREWQAVQRQFIESTGRRRQYDREQIREAAR